MAASTFSLRGLMQIIGATNNVVLVGAPLGAMGPQDCQGLFAGKPAPTFDDTSMPTP